MYRDIIDRHKNGDVTYEMNPGAVEEMNRIDADIKDKAGDRCVKNN